MVHEAPTANVAAQFGAPVGNVPVVTREDVCGVPPPKVKVPPANAEFPVLVTVNSIGLLAVPVAQLPKAKGLGLTLAV